MPDRRSEIVDLFVRDLDKIELPPHDRWRPAHRKESYFAKTSRYVLYAGGVTAVLIAALIVGFGLRDRNSQATASPSPTPAFITLPLPASSPPATPSPAATWSLSTAPLGAIAVACGSVTGYASDGAQMLLTLGSGSMTTQYHLEYHFASVRPPADIGDRFASKTDQLVQVYGRQVPASPGSANAVRLRDFTATRVTTCSPTLSVAPAAFTGFVLPPDCAYVRPPALAFDQSERSFDCPGGTLLAVETLAPAFRQQGWISCATGPGRGYWKKDATLLVVQQVANDRPLLVQYPGTTSCP